MPRSAVFGNGELLITLDSRGYVADFYFPYAGLENHVSGHRHKVGVWDGRRLSWLEDEDWQVRIAYEPDTLVGRLTASNRKMAIELEVTDVCYNERNIFLRRFKLINHASQRRTLKVFFHQEFRISEAAFGTTAYYHPRIPAMVHYRGQRVFMVGATSQGRPFQEYAAGNAHYQQFEGTWRDAEDGRLSMHAIEHGIVDSVIGCRVTVGSNSEELVYYWVAAGKSIEEVELLHNYLLSKGPQHLIRTTGDFWRAWVNKHHFTFYGLTPAHIELFKRSLLVIRTHCDNRGGIIASGDSELLQGGKDTYAYVWPRDGAFTAMALDRAGYANISRRFYNFAKDLLYGEGYFMHKYLPDRSLGSSWHAWISKGNFRLPIQEDEVALVLWGLWRHYLYSKDIEFIESIYNSFIKRVAHFLLDYRDFETGLPRESYDLWEEIYGTTTFTASAVFGALQAAGFFARTLGKRQEARLYQEKAEQIKTAILKLLFLPKKGYFARAINHQSGIKKEKVIDKTIDASSFYGVFHFGVLTAADKRLESAVQQTRDNLAVDREKKMIARHEQDDYHQTNKNFPGNPWIITSAWLAEYEIERARSERELVKALDSISAITRCVSSAGLLPEQVEPTNHQPLSVAPLTWSHAQYVQVVLAYMQRLEQLGVAKMCAAPFEEQI